MKGQDSSQFNSEDHELPLKGHVYCKALFDEVFLPVLKERFPDVLPRLSGWSRIMPELSGSDANSSVVPMTTR